MAYFSSLNKIQTNVQLLAVRLGDSYNAKVFDLILDVDQKTNCSPKTSEIERADLGSTSNQTKVTVNELLIVIKMIFKTDS